MTDAGVPSFVAAAGCHRGRRVPRVGWPPHGRAPTAVRASATGGSDGIDTPDEPVFLGKKGRMAKMVDMSRRELGESDAAQGVQVFLVEFGLIAMGVVDTLMVGHVGEAALAAALRDAGIRAELYQGNPKQFGKQLQYADRRGSAVAVIQGGDERAAGQVQLKDLIAGAEAAKVIESREEWVEQQPAQISVAEADLVAEVRKILARHGN